MGKRIKDLTDKELEYLFRKLCPKYIPRQCYDCPLDIEGWCYSDIKEKLEKTIEVEENDEL